MKELLTSFFLFLSFFSMCQYEMEFEPPEEEPEAAPHMVTYRFHIQKNIADSCFRFNFENMYTRDGDTVKQYLSNIRIRKDTIRRTLNYGDSYGGGRRIYDIIYYPDCISDEPAVIRFHEFDGENYPEVVFHTLPSAPGYYEPFFESSFEQNSYNYRHYEKINEDYQWNAIPFEDRKLSTTNDKIIRRILPDRL